MATKTPSVDVIIHLVALTHTFCAETILNHYSSHTLTTLMAGYRDEGYIAHVKKDSKNAFICSDHLHNCIDHV